MSISQTEFLEHILVEIEYLKRYSSHLSFDQFIQDETLKRACTRSLEIIGEASKKLSNDLKSRYTEIDWKSITGTRDKLIHDYFGVDFEIVWDILKNKIPIFEKQIRTILQREVKK